MSEHGWPKVRIGSAPSSETHYGSEVDIEPNEGFSA